MALRAQTGPYFGDFGGRFVPESLIAALDELGEAYDLAKLDPAFGAELAELGRSYTGRPSIITEVPRFASHAGGARIILKREDLNHTGSHKINNVLGQALLTKRIGKSRVIAETGAGQHGVATATAAALFGLECTVYMGEVDTERQALNVARMRLLGAEVVAVKAGSRTLKDAINEAMRDWVTNVETTNYIFGTVAGPHPFPEMVRDFQKIIGEEARAQVLELDRCPADRGRRLRRRRFERHRHLPRVPRRRRGRASTASRPPARVSTPTATRRPSPRGGPACCTARAATSSKTTTARPSSRTRSRPDSTTRAWVPSTPGSPRSGGPSTDPSPTPRPWRPCACSPAPRASSPRSSRRTRSPGTLELGRELGPDATILVNLSGRGDKDMDTAAEYFGLYDQEAAE